MSSDSESISSGITLPQWMRPKERTDFDSLAFSPPSHDESFFYIRYPLKKTDDAAKTDVNQISGMLQVAKDAQLKAQHVDFSKHTEPCKRFLQAADSANNSVEGVKNPPKSFGTDDGFKGPGAACGSSIVKVAQQMVSGRSLTGRGFKIAQLEQEEPESDNEFQTKTIEDQQLQTSKLIQAQQFVDENADVQMTQSSRLMIRRGSKSLPSSPLGSPKSMRKYQPNPYFTGTFALAGAKNTTEGRGWFLSSLLGIHRESPSSASSVTNIEEEQENSYSTKTAESSKDYPQKVLRAKPSELREMNFWSPTSM